MRPFASTATTTVVVSNLTTIYGYHSVRDLNLAAIASGDAETDNNYVSTINRAATAAAASVTSPGNNYYHPQQQHTNRMLILSSELQQLNLLEKDNKSQVDGKIVAKRDVKTERQHHPTNNNSNPQIASNVNINQSVNKKIKQYESPPPSSNSTATATTTTSTATTTTTSSEAAAAAIIIATTSNSKHTRREQTLLLPQPQPYKYDALGDDFDAEQQQQQQRQSSVAAKSSSATSTMELECIAGYDGGLPQHFVLEAYDSRTKRLRLNVTSAYTDIPIFRFDLSGKCG